jgi:hypothetical protein
MKLSRRFLALLFAAVLPVAAQEPPAQIATPGTTAAVLPQLNAEQLDQLLGPIALYPDALIALILPASAASTDIVLAARELRESNGQLSSVDDRPWDESVQALAHYPEVLKWMDENLTWTKQLGEVFTAQPADVMNAIQRLRAEARAAGTLVDTPQQQVVLDNSTISIVPAQPDVIYVPYYDPEVVYVSRPAFYSAPLVTFGPAWSTGFWLSFNLDWRHRCVWVINRSERERFWRDHRDFWRRPDFPHRPGFVSNPNYRPWTPPPRTWHAPRYAGSPGIPRPVVRPAPFAGAPRFRSDNQRADIDGRRTAPARVSTPNTAVTGPAFNRRDRNSPERISPPTRRTPPAVVATTPQLQLVNPLPQPLPSPSPVPGFRRPANPPATRSDGSRHIQRPPIVAGNPVAPVAPPAYVHRGGNGRGPANPPAHIAPVPHPSPATTPAPAQARPAPAPAQPAPNAVERVRSLRTLGM